MSLQSIRRAVETARNGIAQKMAVERALKKAGGYQRVENHRIHGETATIWLGTPYGDLALLGGKEPTVCV